MSSRLQKFATALFLITTFSGCSLSPVEDRVHIQIDLSAIAKKSKLQKTSKTSIETLAPNTIPTTVSGFACYGVNITGPGIAESSQFPDPSVMTRFNEAVTLGKSCIYRGVVTQPLGALSGEVNLLVPTGAVRLIQVVGVNDPTICASGVLDNGGNNTGTGKFFELGRAVLNDVFNDRSVDISLTWNALPDNASRVARTLDCGSAASPSPTPSASPAATIVSTGAGAYYNCILYSDGIVKCTGYNLSGSLGDGTTSGRTVYAPVSGLTGVTAISVGQGHVCAISSGAAYCWGSNTFGKVGTGSTTPSTILSPTAVTGLTGTVTSISAGATHSCAIISGSVYCWGANTYGQFGVSTPSQSATAVASTGFGTGATQVSVGQDITCVLYSTGGVKCAGQNANGGLGDGTGTGTSSTPVTPVGMTSGITKLSAQGFGHFCSITTSYAVKCWGANSSTGAVGNGNTGSDVTSPVAVNFGGTLQSEVSVAQLHTCSISSSTGTLSCWGLNDSGNLLGFTGGTVGGTYPTPQGVTLSGATQLSAGVAHSCAIASGSLYCWGKNINGAFGNGTTTSSDVPVLITP